MARQALVKKAAVKKAVEKQREYEVVYWELIRLSRYVMAENAERAAAIGEAKHLGRGWAGYKEIACGTNGVEEVYLGSEQVYSRGTRAGMPYLYADGEVLRTLVRLTEKVRRAKEIRRTGRLREEDWNELYMLLCEAETVIQKARKDMKP